MIKAGQHSGKRQFQYSLDESLLQQLSYKYF